MAYAVIPGPLPANRISPRGRRWAGGVAALVVLGACAPDSDTDRPMAAVRVAAETTDLGFAPGSLEWSSCGGRLECATLEVPLDYDDPTGPMISVAVAMYPARGPEARVGVLVTNPGGPGNSGIDFISGGGPFNDEINRRFDVVSWDPRGVGRSEPLRCGAEIAELFLTSDLAPVDAVGRATLARAARGTAVKCGEANGALLEHVGTDDAVNDVEAIRLALGGEPLTYVGFSYGTRIGLRYAERFPTSLRAMAIDGVVDPEHALADQMTTTALGIDRSLAEVLAACGTDCPIDGDPLTAFRVLVEQTRTEPLHTDDGREVDPNAVVLAGMAVTYDESFNTPFYAAIAEGQRGLGNLVQQFADGFIGQFDPASTVAINCLDLPHPTTVDDVERTATAAAREATVVPGLVSGYVRAFALPCIDWATTAPDALQPVTAAGSPAILVIGNTGDNATPYESANRIAGSLEHGRLLTYHGAGHTTYSKNQCADTFIDAYLLDLTLPPNGADCGSAESTPRRARSPTRR